MKDFLVNFVVAAGMFAAICYVVREVLITMAMF